MFFSENSVWCSKPRVKEEETNHITSELYHDRTDLIEASIFLTLPVAYNCYPDPFTQTLYNYWISWLHLSTSTFPTQTYMKSPIFYVSGQGLVQHKEGMLSFGLLDRLVSNENRILTTEPVTTKI